jgi:glycosyltransferase involved in cell wall biosynthesis
VLPYTGEFDSRTYRIARTLHERGHQVTVLARSKPGLPDHEIHEVGYPIIRVDATPADGVPPWLLSIFRRIHPALVALRIAAAPAARRTPSTRGGAVDPGGESSSARAETAADAGETAADAGQPGPMASDVGWLRRSVRRLRGYVRRARMFFVIRSHRRRASEVGPAADVYHGMAYMGIPVALALGERNHGKVVYDSRDIYMIAANLARLGGPIKAALVHLERGWARAADRVFTVNQPYADELATRFDVPAPAIVMNCSYRYTPPAERPRLFQEHLGLDPDIDIVLYQGAFMHGRGVEELMEAIRHVPRAVLVVMGYGAREAEFRAMAERPEYKGRVFVLPAVPPTKLLDWVTSADVVGVLFQDDTLNHYLSTPNKFLEAMAAGVPSVCSDHPGMAPIARATGCGIPVKPDDIPAIAAAIRTILDAPEPEREARRAAALKAAHDTYNWEAQVGTLLDEYTRLTGRRW